MDLVLKANFDLFFAKVIVNFIFEQSEWRKGTMVGLYSKTKSNEVWKLF
jgi:hypothetical protein